MPRNPTPVSGQIFSDGDLVWKMYAQTDFVGCTFNGTAKNCNFAEADFQTCTFNPTFTFESCNLGGTTGLPERLAPQPQPEFPMRPGAPGTRPGMR